MGKNLAVLAEIAAEIAAYRSKRKGFGTRQKVEKRFLFNRINTNTDGMSERGENALRVPVFPNVTETTAALFEVTVARAVVANDHKKSFRKSGRSGKWPQESPASCPLLFKHGFSRIKRIFTD